MAGAGDVSTLETLAKSLLETAIKREGEKRFTESLAFYEEGIGKLIAVLKGLPENTEKKSRFREKITQYMNHAEEIKAYVQKQKESGKYHEQIQIANGSSGFGYNKIFPSFIDEILTGVDVDDPYIRSTHQIQNFVRFCELLVSCGPNMRRIVLNTGLDDNADKQKHQKRSLKQLSESLQCRRISLMVNYLPDLHDREIRFDNGWIFKIGRGLDYFKPPQSNFAVGTFDLNLRNCHETTIDIFHRSQLMTGKRTGVT